MGLRNCGGGIEFGDGVFESNCGQVVELAKAMDATVVEAGQDVHIDGQEADRQRGEEISPEIGRIGHTQGVSGSRDAGGAMGGAVIGRDTDLGFPVVGYAGHEVGDDAGFLRWVCVVSVDLCVGGARAGVVHDVDDASQAVDDGAPLLRVDGGVCRDRNGIAAAGERSIKWHFGMDAPSGCCVHDAAQR